MNSDRKTYQFSFCHKENTEVSRMIAGPYDVHIRAGCVAKCNDIIADAQATEAGA